MLRNQNSNFIGYKLVLSSFRWPVLGAKPILVCTLTKYIIFQFNEWPPHRYENIKMMLTFGFIKVMNLWFWVLWLMIRVGLILIGDDPHFYCLFEWAINSKVNIRSIDLPVLRAYRERFGETDVWTDKTDIFRRRLCERVIFVFTIWTN